MAPCPAGHRQSAVTVARGLGIAKPSAARASHPWAKDHGSPLLRWLVEHYPLCPALSCRSACLQASGPLPVTHRTQKPGSKSLASPGWVTARPTVGSQGR